MKKSTAILPLLCLAIAGCVAPGTTAPSGSDPAIATAPASAEPLVSPTATASTSVEPSVNPSAGPLAAGDWVVTAAEGVTLRQRAGTDADALGRLPAGSAGVIAGGPVEADGYTWYAVAAPGLGDEPCNPEDDPVACPIWFGWLAAADLDGNAWLVGATPPCPDVPTTATEFLHQPINLLYSCFRGETLTVVAHVGELPSTLECFLPYTVEPAWLFVCSRAVLQESATAPEHAQTFDVQLHPSLGECGFGGRSGEACPLDPLQGHDIEVDGHFDDPAAETCAADGPPGVELDPVSIVYACRAAFVVTSVRSIAGP
jgi:hypothetical protein